VDAKDNKGWTPLHWATQEGCLEVAKILVSFGADVNAKDNAGWTPLNCADYNTDYNTRKAMKQYLDRQNLTTPETPML